MRDRSVHSGQTVELKDAITIMCWVSVLTKSLHKCPPITDVHEVFFDFFLTNFIVVLDFSVKYD